MYPPPNYPTPEPYHYQRPPTDPPPPRRRWRKILPWAVPALILLVLGATYLVVRDTGKDSPPAPSATFDSQAPQGLHGTLTLHADKITDVMSMADGSTGIVVGYPGGVPDCSAFGGYDDLRAGTSVTVYDAAGKVVGTGALQAGHLPVGDDGNDRYSAQCAFDWEVSNVPRVTTFYQIEIGRRGKIVASAAEATGSLDSTLGR